MYKRFGSVILLTNGILSRITVKHTCQQLTYLQVLQNSSKIQIGCRGLTSMMAPAKKLEEWSFSEPKLPSLPLDPETENFVRRSVPKTVFSLTAPTPFKTKPQLVAFSEDVLRNILDMDPEITKDDKFVDWVTGNKVLEGSVPLAHRYGGFQFGYWAEQLGDGRAHLLGEYINSRGERWELQLKGSGRTPYSRFGDGRAVLRSSVREFLCSEAMHYLGVPTSRAATLTVTDDPIPRDLFYNGNVKNERGAVVLRIAPSWFRIGSLEILTKSREFDELKILADFILTNNFPHIKEKGEEGYLAMFAEVCEHTAHLIAKWQSIGWAHGVLNTDNMSLASVTIDYGPFGFVDAYDPNFTPNHSDDMGRYDLENQGNIGLWNMQKLGNALAPLINNSKHNQLVDVLKGYSKQYQDKYLELFRKKLGLDTNALNEEDISKDEELIALLLQTMEVTKADFTQTFRDLGELSIDDLERNKIPESAWGLTTCLKSTKIKDFLKSYTERIKELKLEDEKRMENMQAANPRYILRNWIAQEAIQRAEENDFTEVQFLLELFKNPYKINKDAEAKGFASPPPNWANKLVLSCSS